MFDATDFSQFLPLLQQAMTGRAGLYALAFFLITWATGKGLVAAMQKPWVQRILAKGLKTADIPGALVGGWLQAGPLRIFFAPIVCLLIFAGFYFTSFLHKVMSYLKPDTLLMVQGLYAVLDREGSERRKLYIQSVAMPQAKVRAAAAIAEAVSNPSRSLDPEQRQVFERAAEIGAALQAERLK